MKTRASILFLFFLAIATGLFAQEIKVDAVLDTSKIRIGEQVRVDLYVNYDADQKDLRIEWPTIGDTITGKVEVISVSPIDTTFPDKTNSSRIFQHQQIIVSVYDSGMYLIPAFKFVLNNDTNKTVFTQPLFLEVHTVPTDTSAAKIKDIKATFDEPFNWKWYLNYIYAGIGLLCLIVAVVIITNYYNKRRRQIIAEPEKPKVPAHITALASLERIREEQIWKEEKIKEYYSAISDAIRLYIEERFNVNALESTTDEIMLAFRSQVVDRESKDKLQQLLMLSDLVKFAKMFPIENEHVFTLQNAVDFVNGTKREEEVQIVDETRVNARGAEQTVHTSERTIEKPIPVQNGMHSNYTIPSNGPARHNLKTKEQKQSIFKKIVRYKYFKMIAAFIGAIIVYFSIVVPLNNLAFGTSSYKKGMIVMAEAFNKTCPIAIDSETRLDSLGVINDKTMRYYYTLVNYSEGQIDTKTFEDQMRPGLLNQIKTNPQLKLVRDNSGILQYQYSDKNGKPLLLISLGPEDYLN